MTKEELKEIEAEYSAAVRVLDEVSARRMAARQEMTQQELGVKTGDRLAVGKNHYVLSYLDVRYESSLGKPWAYGMKVLKNGTVSNQVRCLYSDWKKL